MTSRLSKLQLIILIKHRSMRRQKRLLKNKNQLDAILFYYTSYRLSIFQALLCPSSEAYDYNVDYHIGHFVLGLL